MNPLQNIKRIIIAANLRKDMQIARDCTCSFTSIFLSNPFKYQKKYHIVDPLQRPDNSTFPNDSKVFVRTLLDPNTYEKKCQHCSRATKDIFSHFLNQCPKLLKSRRLLELNLSLYNFPKQQFPLNKNALLTLAFGNTCWRKCLANFLMEGNFCKTPANTESVNFWFGFWQHNKSASLS